MIKTRISTKIMIALMTMMMLLSAMAISVSASNTNSGFNYNFNGSTKLTMTRVKENNSSMYMYCQSANTSYLGSARGTINGEKYWDCSYNWNVTGSTKKIYSFTANTARFMYNYVIENGYSRAAISASTSAGGSASGVWSPDSVPQDGVLPPSDYIKE